MNDYKDIFKVYRTTENIPFLMLNRRIVFPDDKTLDIYGRKYIASDTPWTVLSYQLYGTIQYWWVLCALNEYNMYYCKEGSYLTYVKAEYIPLILNSIK